MPSLTEQSTLHNKNYLHNNENKNINQIKNYNKNFNCSCLNKTTNTILNKNDINSNNISNGDQQADFPFYLTELLNNLNEKNNYKLFLKNINQVFITYNFLQ